MIPLELFKRKFPRPSTPADDEPSKTPTAAEETKPAEPSRTITLTEEVLAEPSRDCTESSVSSTPLTEETWFRRRELDRFGIKPLKRKNAVKILNHIYDETHPFVTDSDPEDQELSPIKSQPGNKTRESKSSTSRQMNLDYSSTEQTDSDSEVMMIEQEPNTEEERLPPSSQLTQSGDLSHRLKQFVLEQPDIHRKVVLYEPIWLSEIHQKIKEAGIKCSQEKLMDWLDDEGITFRMPTNLSARGKKSRNLITHRS